MKMKKEKEMKMKYMKMIKIYTKMKKKKKKKDENLKWKIKIIRKLKECEDEKVGENQNGVAKKRREMRRWKKRARTIKIKKR